MSDKDLTPQVPGEEVQEEAAPEVVEPKPRAKGKAAAFGSWRLFTHAL